MNGLPRNIQGDEPDEDDGLGARRVALLARMRRLSEPVSGLSDKTPGDPDDSDIDPLSAKKNRKGYSLPNPSVPIGLLMSVLGSYSAGSPTLGASYTPGEGLDFDPYGNLLDAILGRLRPQGGSSDDSSDDEE